MRKDRTIGYRRSARISELEEKARLRALEKPISNDDDDDSTSSSPPPPPSSTTRKRGRKCKSLQAVVINSSNQEGEDSKQEDNATKAEKSSSPPGMPKKQTLEFLLDILQRRDTEEIFAQPVDPDEVADYYSIIKEPMDFGTMRAKLQEGMYTSLEQFERDVFLISSNAMKFNSSTTVYYTEARAISDLAQRLFHSLKTEPENFQLEYSRTRRRSGRKPEAESGHLHHKSSKPGSSRNGVSNIDQPVRKNTESFHSPSFLKPYARHSRNGNLPGSRIATGLRSSETERRMTYMPTALSLGGETGKMVSAVYNAPKLLAHVNHPGTPYKDSINRFVKDLGPTAQLVANKKLEKYTIEAPNRNSWFSSSFGRASDCLFPTPSALQSPLRLNEGGNANQMPGNFISNSSASYKGKMVYTNEGTTQSSFGMRPCASNGGLMDYRWLGDRGANMSMNTGAGGSAKEKTAGSAESADLLLATLMQIGAIQTRTQEFPSGTYYPVTGYQDLASASSSHVNKDSQFWMQTKPSEPTYLPYPSTARATASFYPNGEGSSMTGPVGMNQINNETRSWMQNVSEQTFLPFSSTGRATASLYRNGEGPSTPNPAALYHINNEVQPWTKNKPSEITFLPYPSTSRAATSLYQLGEGQTATPVGPALSNQNNNESQPWMRNKPSESAYLPFSSTSRATTSVYQLGEGQRAASSPAVSNQNNNESQSWMRNKPSEPSYLPYSSTSNSSASLYPNGEGSSASLWGLPPICDLPVLQTQVNEQVPLMQQQSSQLSSAQEVPLYNTMNFFGGANSQRNQAESSTSSAQRVWNGRLSALLDNKHPDLDLQL